MYTPEYFVIDKNSIMVDKAELKRRLSVSGDFDLSVFDESMCELLEIITPKCCFVKVPVSKDGDKVNVGFAVWQSGDLCRNLAECGDAFIFAVTLGHRVDRLLSKLSLLSPANFFVSDAIGSALAESVCDAAEKVIKGTLSCRPRFSPGYGDLDISVQRQVLMALNAEKLLGITLTDSNLMLPQKSITAIVGIKE